jgi:hypothetical protein
MCGQWDASLQRCLAAQRYFPAMIVRVRGCMGMEARCSWKGADIDQMRRIFSVVGSPEYVDDVLYCVCAQSALRVQSVQGSRARISAGF